MGNDNVVDAQNEDSTTAPSKNDHYKAEQARICLRRKYLKTEVDKEAAHGEYQPSSIWGLALSGGGIRSATFGLGVLQAMARAKAPDIRPANARTGSGEFLLAHFDYLSTVSGGGYIGAFYCSLFQGGRLRPYVEPASRTPYPISDSTVVEAAANAFKVLQFEPPGRIHSTVHYDDCEGCKVGNGPTAWLRENGRYLTPSGAGDLLYGVALTVRNWLSVHFVIGMPILFVLAAMNVSLMTLMNHAPRAIGEWQLPELARSLWLLPASILMLWVIPLGVAFWLFYSKKSAEHDKCWMFNRAFGSCALLVVILIYLIVARRQYLPEHLWLTLILAAQVMTVAMFWAFWISTEPVIGGNTVRTFRIKVTKYLATSINCLLGSAFLVAAFESSRALYLWFASTSPFLSLTPAATLAGLVWLTRAVAQLLDERPEKKSLLSLPLPLLTMLLGMTMLSLTIVSWGILLHWLLAFECCLIWSFSQLAGALVVLGTIAPFVIISGLFIGFINLSSFQALYSARLTRAYLGASNGFRFKWSEIAKEREDKLSVSEALPGDDLSLEEYFGSATLAPLHLINITVNLTADMTGQLVQRDRKGLPLCIAPGSYRYDVLDAFSYSFIMDGVARIRDGKHRIFSEADQPLTLGHWIATSGAAFSTGMGRTTSLGTSLVCGLANVRLGTWWPANFTEDDKPDDQRITIRNPWYAKCFPTPYYLYKEFTAQFDGLRSKYQYLSDGGHFENTGVYELLRPQRRLDLIVLCDCGADPGYNFEDLANLIRLARLDLELEIEADTGYLRDSRYRALKSVLGVYEDFLTGDVLKQGEDGSKRADDQCALLFNVFNRDEDSAPRRLVCVLLVIKPNIITRLSDDVQFYWVTHPTFPNEPTIDQFFNESQFESYRQLGLNTGQLLFGTGRKRKNGKPGKKQDCHEALLWKYLKQRIKKIDHCTHGVRTCQQPAPHSSAQTAHAP